MRNPFWFLLILFLFSCGQPPKNVVVANKPVVTVYSTPKGDKVLFLDVYYRSFLKGVKAGSKNYDSLYKADISSPIIADYFSKSEYSYLVGFNYYYAILDTAGLQNGIVALARNEKKIEDLITTSLADANKFLTNDSLTIYIEPANSNLKDIAQKMGGVMAVTAGSKQILITIDFTVSTWEEMLKYCIAHEFEHTYWTKMNFNKSAHFTLLDYLIFEGRADSYADMIYPDTKCPWTMALSEQEKIDLWKILEPKLQSEDQALQHEVMFGSDNYPQWGGYTMGFSIVQSALRNNPKLTPLDWATMEPSKILEMSNYK